MLLARGEYVVIYDAEDMPEPDQLKKAIVAFQKSDDRLTCVQANLGNAGESAPFQNSAALSCSTLSASMRAPSRLQMISDASSRSRAASNFPIAARR